MVKLSNLLAGCVCVVLGGCALAGGSTPPETYDLAAVRSIKPSARKSSVYVAVAVPNTARPLDTDQILVRDPGGRLSYFPGSAWGDRLPKLVQSRLVQALADSGHFRGVGTSQDRVPGDVTLSIDMRSFNIEVTNGHAEAVVDIVVKIVNERRDRVIATRQFTVKAPAVKDDAVAGVSALNQAFDQVAGEVANWAAASRAA
jgi:cholesterol transport system auxiliary component